MHLTFHLMFQTPDYRVCCVAHQRISLAAFARPEPGRANEAGRRRGIARRWLFGGRARAREVRLPRPRAADKPDWDAEMSLFRKRLQKPNQLETLRKIEAEASVGKVRAFPHGAHSRSRR